jgi:hypothetical protein
MASALFGRATWSNSPTINDVTLPAEFMMKFALKQCKSYASWRASPYKWLVVRSVDLDVHSFIPCFHRLYTVTSQEFDNRVCLIGNCNYFECNGVAGLPTHDACEEVLCKQSKHQSPRHFSALVEIIYLFLNEEGK